MSYDSQSALNMFLDDCFTTPELVLGRTLMERAVAELRTTPYLAGRPVRPAQWVNWWLRYYDFVPWTQWLISAKCMILYMEEFPVSGGQEAIAHLLEMEPRLATYELRAQ